MNAHEDRARDFLLHIAEALDKIPQYTSGVDRDAFWLNSMLQDAVIRNIEIVGEAAKQLQDAAPDFSKSHSEIPFAHIYGMRNRVIHRYATVDLSVVWETVQIDVPELRSLVTTILDDDDPRATS